MQKIVFLNIVNRLRRFKKKKSNELFEEILNFQSKTWLGKRTLLSHRIQIWAFDLFSFLVLSS